jgi:hypothetical protein
MIVTRATNECDRCHTKFAEKDALYISEIPHDSILLCYECASFFQELEKIIKQSFKKEK